jgi:hypothetical protein
MEIIEFVAYCGNQSNKAPWRLVPVSKSQSKDARQRIERIPGFTDQGVGDS